MKDGGMLILKYRRADLDLNAGDTQLAVTGNVTTAGRSSLRYPHRCVFRDSTRATVGWDAGSPKGEEGGMKS